MWICRQCQTQIAEEDFDVCWNCQTPRTPEDAQQAQGPQPAAGPQIPSPPPLPRAGLRPTCAVCSSDKMMHGFELREDTPFMVRSHRIWAVLKDEAIPSAEVRVSICGQCGHVHLTAVDAGTIYRDYRSWLQNDDEPGGEPVE